MDLHFRREQSSPSSPTHLIFFLSLLRIYVTFFLVFLTYRTRRPTTTIATAPQTLLRRSFLASQDTPDLLRPTEQLRLVLLYAPVPLPSLLVPFFAICLSPAMAPP